MGTIMDIPAKTPVQGYTAREALEGISERLDPFSGTDTLGDDERPREIPRSASPRSHSSW